MDKKLERSNTDKVLRRFAKHIRGYGFKRTKPTFFVREAGPVVEFIHLHKYTFGPCFRMHICFRVLNESKDFVALSGPTEREFLQDVSFDFAKNIESVDCCAKDLSDFVANYVEPWFKHWSDRSLLLKDSSPLYDDQKVALEAALNDKPNSSNLERSKSLFKIV
jgi:hypothetical protein